jgi:diguanylate cyclase (GGDEF)-like protein
VDILSHADRLDVPLRDHDDAEVELARLRAEVAWLQTERAVLWWAVNHDELTGLANRRLLNALGPTLLSKAARCAVAVLDLNGFKPINDKHGHAVGDEVLRIVAHRLSFCIGDDLAVRLSGDEFAAILTESTFTGSRGDWSALIDTISEAIAEPMEIDGKQLVVTASIGLAVADNDSFDMTDLLHRADLDMYRVKAVGYYSKKGWD